MTYSDIHNYGASCAHSRVNAGQGGLSCVDFLGLVTRRQKCCISNDRSWHLYNDQAGASIDWNELAL